MTVRPPELAVETSGPCVAAVVLVVLDGGDVELVLEIDPLVSGDRSVVVDPVPDVVEVPCGDVESVFEVGPLVPGSSVVDSVSEVDVPEVFGGDGREVVEEWFARASGDVLVWPPEQAAASTPMEAITTAHANSLGRRTIVTTHTLTPSLMRFNTCVAR
jgi:hypothetical protein